MEVRLWHESTGVITDASPSILPSLSSSQSSIDHRCRLKSTLTIINSGANTNAINTTVGTLEGVFISKRSTGLLFLIIRPKIRGEPMKKISLFILTAITAVVFTACEPAANMPAANTNTANANAAKPVAAAPTTAALLDMEKKAFDAWAKKDGKHFEGLLADNFVSYDRGKRMSKADEIKMINESKCEIKSHTVSDEKMIPVGPDAAVLVSKATVDGTCDGEKIPAAMTSATLFVRSGDTWKAAYHGQTAVIDPKSPPPAEPAKKDEAKKDDSAAKTDPAANAKKEDSKPADDASDTMTKSLLALETSGWEAWRAKDTAKLDPMLTNDVAFVDPMGMAHFGKAANLKTWSDQKCEVKSVNLSDAAGSSASPTVAILTFKGTADGTCDGQKLGPVWGTAIYQKEGEAWKLAFHMESPA